MNISSSFTQTTCPYCGVGCGVLAKPNEDGSAEIKGDDTHPANYGRLCSKGSALGQTTHLKDRLLYPEIYGEKASWDDALDKIATQFKDILETDGPDAIAFYVSGQILTEDYYVANKLIKGFIGTANIDTNSRLCMASSVAGHKRAFGSDTVPGCYEDFEKAGLITLVGSNLAWCHPVLYQRIMAAKENNPNLKIVLIDPRRTASADSADIHLDIKPDGDIPLFLGLLNAIQAQGKIDQNYVDRFTNGFADALAHAQNYSLEDIIEQTGLSREKLTAFYDLYCDTEKALTIYSQGVNQSVCGTDKVNAIINCHLATGRIGKEGMGPFSITGQPNAMGGREVGGLANMLACHMDIDNAEHQALVSDFWQTSHLATSQGLKAVDMFDAVHKGKIKAIWIMATNPVDSMPNANKVSEALEKCPLVIVSDVKNNNDTIAYAHIKLPSLAWAEKSGTVTNSERRISRQRPFMPAPGEAKADWWQMAKVGEKLGFTEAFSWQNASEVFTEYAAMSAYENNGSRDFDIGAWADASEEDYDTLKPFQWPQPKEAHSAPSNTRFFANGGFYTPDKKARFIIPTVPEQHVFEDEDILHLNTGRIRDHWHTMTRTALSPTLSNHLAEPFCEIHPRDAEKRDIKDADIVRIDNNQGHIFVRALITDRVAKGEIFVPMHWTDQVSANARVDQLLPDVKDPFSGQPALKFGRVKLVHAKMQSYGFAIFTQEPDLRAIKDFDYWSIATCEGGYRVEFASKTAFSDLNPSGLSNRFAIAKDCAPLSYIDETSQQKRFAWFEDNNLLAAVFIAAHPVNAARDYISSLLKYEFKSLSDQFLTLSPVPRQDMPDKGKIICSCMQVGKNDILNAIENGCETIDAISKTTTAGTNCGSCKPEIREILDGYHSIAAE